MMLVLSFNWDIMEQLLYNGKCYNHEEDLGNLDTSNNIQEVLSIYAETETHCPSKQWLSDLTSSVLTLWEILGLSMMFNTNDPLRNGQK